MPGITLIKHKSRAGLVEPCQIEEIIGRPVLMPSAIIPVIGPQHDYTIIDAG